MRSLGSRPPELLSIPSRKPELSAPISRNQYRHIWYRRYAIPDSVLLDDGEVIMKALCPGILHNSRNEGSGSPKPVPYTATGNIFSGLEPYSMQACVIKRGGLAGSLPLVEQHRILSSFVDPGTWNLWLTWYK